MKKITIDLPKLGESIVEATVVQWLKKPGEWVELDEPLVEVATDKINSEIPSPAAGKMEAFLAEPDQVVKVGEPLAILLVEGKEESFSTSKKEQVKSIVSEEDSSFFSPAVLRLAKEHHISWEELERIPKEGKRLSKKDLEKYLATRNSSKAFLEEQPIKMTPLRKAIAANMVRSFYEAPHASLITEIDVTNLIQQIEKKKEEFLQKQGVKLSITTYFAKALSQVLKQFPHLNASLKEDTIVLKQAVNLGIAVSVEGGILVPVIFNCDTLSLSEIAKKIASLAEKARKQTLTREETEGGTITLTNFGRSGTKIGIPIIHHPEVAIVGMGAIEKAVKVQKDNSLAIRSMIHVSLTFDHRVIDGMYGCSFLQKFKETLEAEKTFS